MNKFFVLILSYCWKVLKILLTYGSIFNVFVVSFELFLLLWTCFVSTCSLDFADRSLSFAGFTGQYIGMNDS